MKHCELFYTNLNIEPDRIQPCCDVLRNIPPSLPYSGGGFPLDRYIEILATAFEENQGNGGPCSNCPLLQDNEQPNQTMLIRNVSINHQRSICNAKCVYCDFWKKPSRSYNIYPTIIDLFDLNILHEEVCFHWGGGEPTMLPEFAEASEYIFLKDKKQSVCTNGIIFSGQIAKLLKTGTCSINISLDCGSSEIYQSVHGVNKFKVVVENIENYISCANDVNDVGIKYIIFKNNDNEDELVRFLKICHDSKCKNVMFSLNFDEVSSNTVSSSTLEVASKIKDIAESYNINAKMFFEPYYKRIIDEYKKTNNKNINIDCASVFKKYLKKFIYKK